MWGCSCASVLLTIGSLGSRGTWAQPFEFSRCEGPYLAALSSHWYISHYEGNMTVWMKLYLSLPDARFSIRRPRLRPPSRLSSRTRYGDALTLHSPRLGWSEYGDGTACEWLAALPQWKLRADLKLLMATFPIRYAGTVVYPGDDVDIIDISQRLCRAWRVADSSVPVACPSYSTFWSQTSHISGRARRHAGAESADLYREGKLHRLLF